MKKLIRISALIIITTISASTIAESLRCNGRLADIGDTKADIAEICGEPIATDNYCEPVEVNLEQQGIQNGNHNTQNVTAIQTCLNVDIWTYNPGKGKFMTHLYFTQGQLRNIRYGNRVK